MAVLKDIRKRIVSVQNTQQITKAMKMVSASKLRKAQQEVESANPYTAKLGSIITKLSQTSDQASNPLFGRDSRNKAVVLVINSDRGLCGAMNNNLDKAVFQKMEELKNEYSVLELALFGRKSRDFFKKFDFGRFCYHGDLKDHEYKMKIQVECEKLIQEYLNEKVDAVFVAFNCFKSVISQEPTVRQLLPIAPLQADENAESPAGGFIFEPSAEEILDTLLKKFVLNQTYTSLLNNIASEHGARMAAMDAATNNASEVISSLKLQYNRARQAAITKELIEIISGADAIS